MHEGGQLCLLFQFVLVSQCCSHILDASCAGLCLNCSIFGMDLILSCSSEDRVCELLVFFTADSVSS